MARVICTLPNCSTVVNGFRFAEDRGEMISEEIPDLTAEHFASIPGFRLAGAPAPAPAPVDPAPVDPAPPAEPATTSTGSKSAKKG